MEKTFKQRKKPMVKKLNLKLGEVPESRFDQDDLVNVLSKVSFDLININLSAKKSYVGLNGNGYTPIGFVNGFNKEDSSFDVVVFENREEAVRKLGDIVVVAKAFTDREGNVTKIISLNVEPVEELEAE